MKDKKSPYQYHISETCYNESFDFLMYRHENYKILNMNTETKPNRDIRKVVKLHDIPQLLPFKADTSHL